MMKTIKDITKKQAIEIANLINPSNRIDKEVEQDYKFKYQPYAPRSIQNSEGDDELIHLYWKAITFGDIIDTVRLTIHSNLDCYWGYIRSNGENSLPTNNQCKIQKKFIEWDIHDSSEPIDEFRDDRINKILE
jgi:hypothetical protein